MNRSPVNPATLARILALVASFAIASSAGAETIEYRVRPQETLFGIARTELGDASRWREIAALNGLAPPYPLREGALILLPGRPASGADVSVSVDTPADAHESSHVVMAEQPRDRMPDSMTAEPLVAESLPREGVRFEDLLAELLRANPSLKAAEARARAAGERPGMEGTPPDPVLTTGLAVDPSTVVMVENGMASTRTENMTMGMVQLSQMIPAGKLAPARRAAEREAVVASSAVAVERARLVRELRTACADLGLVDRTAATLERTRGILRLLVASTEALYRTGGARQADLLRSHLELSMIADRLVMLDGRRRALVATINRLLDRPHDTPLGTPAPARAVPVADVAFTPGAEVRWMEAEVEAARARVEVARSMFVPDIELMAGAEFRRDRDPRVEIGLGISLPVRAARRQGSGLREAEAELEAEEARLHAARAAAREEFEAGLAMARSAYAQVELYRGTILPQARLALDASIAQFRTGGVDFMTVVGNIATLQQYEIAEEEAVASYHRALAMVEQATGGSVMEGRRP